MQTHVSVVAFRVHDGRCFWQRSSLDLLFAKDASLRVGVVQHKVDELFHVALRDTEILEHQLCSGYVALTAWVTDLVGLFEDELESNLRCRATLRVGNARQFDLGEKLGKHTGQRRIARKLTANPAGDDVSHFGVINDAEQPGKLMAQSNILSRIFRQFPQARKLLERLP